MAKRKKINFKSKKTWKNILLIGLACITLVGAIAGISALFKNSKETTKVINPSYAVGGLSVDGKFVDTKESIYTKDAFACQGLDIDVDFRSNVSYKIFFYDDDVFLSSTDTLTENYDETTTPSFATYARVLITPNDDTEIKWYEISKYADQLTISVNKDQLSYIERVETGENVYTLMGRGNFNMFSKEFTQDNSSNYFYSGIIDTSLAKEVIIKVETSELTRLVDYNGSKVQALNLYDLTNSKSLSTDLSELNIIATDGKFSYISINCENFDEFVLSTSSFAVDTTAIYLV